jgi:hypothetical protein
MEDVCSSLNETREDGSDILKGIAIFDALFNRKAQGDRKIWAHRFANLLQDFNDEPAAVAETAPIFIVTFVGKG